jgi:peptidoglycan hydrolase-like protein with peptidoglycan-binding domain
MKRLALLAATGFLASGCAQAPVATAPTATPAAAQYRPPQPSAAVRDAQDRLSRLGFYNGPADGLRGPETDAAIERFQQAQGLTASGQLDAATSDALRAEPGRGAILPVGISTTDRRAVQQVQGRLRQLGFYHGPGDGAWGPETAAALKRFQSVRGLDVTGQPTQATLTALGVHPSRAADAGSVAQPLDPAVVRTIQQRLSRAGYYTGRIDGVWGPQAEAAVERFQRGNGLQSTGELNPTTLSALGLDPNNLAGQGSGSSLQR